MNEYGWIQANPFADGILPTATEPQHVKTIGEPAAAPMGIYLSQEAAHFIDTFIQANPERSLGGILVGYVAQSETRPFILITGAIEAKTTTDGSSIQFVSATWDYLREVWHREYPGTLVLGWFHSTPGQGAHLTQYDHFTHHRLFACPWQVAFVIDPLQSESVFYHWADERLVLLDSFYLWDAERDPPLLQGLAQDNLTEVPTTTQNVADEGPTYKRGKRPFLVWVRRSYLWLVLMMLGIGLFAVFPWLVRNLPGTGGLLTDAQARLQSLNTQLQQATIVQTHTPVVAPSALTPYSEAGPVEPVTSNVTALTSIAMPPVELLPSARSTSLGYTVEPGDTLWDISNRILGDPHAYKSLADLNAISNPDLIYPGMSLQVEKTEDASADAD